ncbi:MAG: hypothetical protein AB8B97_11005 [Granulosicoccus sp.]
MARKTWVVKGTLKLRQLPLIYKDGDKWVPLGGVTIKISAFEGIRWNSWGTVTTGPDGSFCMRKKKDGTKRKIRIEVKFKNKYTVVYGENASLLSKALNAFNPISAFNKGATQALDAILTHTSKVTYKADYYTLKESEDRNTSGGDYEFDYGTISIGKAASGHIYEQAAIFYACEKLRKHLADMGHPFVKKIAVKYPHDNKLINDEAEFSYCSPINNCVYMVKNTDKDSMYKDGEVTFNTLYHELMHLWTYGYSSGEDNLALQLARHGSTHDGLQNKTYTAFHEAWAEHSSNVLLKTLFNETSYIYGNQAYWPFPFSKPVLVNEGITKLSEVDRHEYGWMHIFNCLTCDNLTNFNTNLQQESNYQNNLFWARVDTRDIDNIPSLDIYDLMQAFKAPEPYPVKQMNLDDFMDRIQKIEPEITNSIRAGYIKVFDPKESRPPRDCF